MNKIWKFNWISNKEYRCIISCHIPISFFCVEFNSKASWISFCISWAFLSSYCRKSSKNWCSLSNCIENFCFAKLCYISSYFKISVSTFCKFKYKIPAPLACTTLSGILSLSKCANLSIRWKSYNKMGPYSPAVNEF